MTTPTLPATGGRYQRREDNTLERIEEVPPARKPDAKRPAKKEDT